MEYKDDVTAALEELTKTENNSDDAKKKAEEEAKLKADAEAEAKKKAEETSKNNGTTEQKKFFEKIKEKGIEVNSDEEAENYVLDAIRKRAEVESREAELKKQLDEFSGYKEVIEQGFDPLQFFPSVEDYKAMQLKKQLPNLDGDTAKKVFATDVKSLSPEELITLDLKIKYPTLNDNDIKDMFIEKYGEAEDRTGGKIAVMKIDAAEAAKNVLALKETIKDPSKIDPKAAKLQQDTINAETLKKIETDWTRESDSIIFSKIDVTKVVDGKEVVIYSQDVEGDYKTRVKSEIIEFAKANKIPLTKDSVAFVQAEMREQYRREHMAQIMEKYAKDEVRKAREEWDKENTGMGGHISRNGDGSASGLQITDGDVENMLHGRQQGSSGIRKIKYD